MSRGMSLLEVTIAVALLAGLVVAATGWTTMSASMSKRLSAEAGWALAASATLDLIQDDLLCGDPTITPIDERVVVETGRLIIVTRDALGACIHTFELDDDVLVFRRHPSNSGQEVRRLLDDVARFASQVDDERVLTVTLQRADDVPIQRSWSLP